MESSVTPLSSLKDTLTDFVKFSTWICADYRCKRAFLSQSGALQLGQDGPNYYYLLPLVNLFLPHILRLECRFGESVGQREDSSDRENKL